MLHSARLKLTIWYLILIMSISMLFSIAIYGILDRGFEREIHIFSRRYTQIEYQVSIYPHLEVGYLQSAENRIKLLLIYINLAILAISGIIAYFFAGKTLQPIQDMMNEQNRFIADSSHEFRTPLTSLKSQFEVYLRGKKHTVEDSEELVKSSLEEVNNLQNLSDNLLQLAQYQKPNDNIIVSIAGIKQILQESIRKIQPLAKSKQITLHNKIEDYKIKGDKQSLVQLFVILLDNAVKYSQPDSIITINSTSDDRLVSIDIIDQGIGIDKKIIPHIFNRFYRADASRNKQQADGYGLGLAIAKKIVEIHKGTITLKSQLTKGTTFTVQLPKP